MAYELHVQIRGVSRPRGPDGSVGPYELYCAARAGAARHRTRQVTSGGPAGGGAGGGSVRWDEEVVFSSAEVAAARGVVTFEIWDARLLADELVAKGFLDLAFCTPPPSAPSAPSAPSSPAPSRRGTGAAAPPDEAALLRPPPGAREQIAEEEEEEEEISAAEAAAIAAAAVASRGGGDGRRSSSFAGGGTAGGAGAAASPFAPYASRAPPPPPPAASLAPSPVERQVLPLLPATALAGAAIQALRLGRKSAADGDGGGGGGHQQPPAKMKRQLTRSTASLGRSKHVASRGDLHVELWWVPEAQALAGGGGPTMLPPRVVSFVPPPRARRALPSVAHAPGATLYEEPCVAFVRLSISTAALGVAGALATPKEAAARLKKLTMGGETASRELARVLAEQRRRRRRLGRAFPGMALGNVGGGAPGYDGGDDDDDDDDDDEEEDDDDEDDDDDHGGLESAFASRTGGVTVPSSSLASPLRDCDSAGAPGGSGFQRAASLLRRLGSSSGGGGGGGGGGSFRSSSGGGGAGGQRGGGADGGSSSSAQAAAAALEAEARAKRAEADAAFMRFVTTPEALAAGGDEVGLQAAQARPALRASAAAAAAAAAAEEAGGGGPSRRRSGGGGGSSKFEPPPLPLYVAVRVTLGLPGAGPTAPAAASAPDGLASAADADAASASYPARAAAAAPHAAVPPQAARGEVRVLRPSPVSPLDGSAALRQHAVFCVTRPLADRMVTVEMTLHRGPRGPAMLSLCFQQPLVTLLRKSPRAPSSFDAWRALRHNAPLPPPSAGAGGGAAAAAAAAAQSGSLRVPLPGLPDAGVELVASIADVDLRAGMYGVRAVQGTPFEVAQAQALAASSFGALPPPPSPPQPQTSLLAEPDGAVTTGLRRRLADTSRGRDLLERADGLLRERVAPQVERAVGLLPAPLARSARRTLVGRLFREAPLEVVHFGTDLRLPSMAPWRSGGGVGGEEAGGGYGGGGGGGPSDFSGGATAAAGESGGGGGAAAARARRDSLLVGNVSLVVGGAGDDDDGAAARTSGGGGVRGARPQPPAAAAAAASRLAVAALRQDQYEAHPNLRVSGTLGLGPLAVLHLTIVDVVIEGKSAGGGGRLFGGGGGGGGGSASGQAAAGALLQRAASGGRTSSSDAAAADQQQQQQQAPSYPSISLDGMGLLLRCGPHWLDAKADIVPLSLAGGRGGGGSGGGAGPTATARPPRLLTTAQPLQVRVPVYSPLVEFSLVLHRKGHAIGRLAFRVTGLLPLLAAPRSRTLTLFSDRAETDRALRGRRRKAGRVALWLHVTPPSSGLSAAASALPGDAEDDDGEGGGVGSSPFGRPRRPAFASSSPHRPRSRLAALLASLSPARPLARALKAKDRLAARLAAAARLLGAYLLSRHPLSMHTSAILASVPREARDDAVSSVSRRWLTASARPPLPGPLVHQLVSTGRNRASMARVRRHLRRLKAVVGWMPHRIDPVGFFLWRRPLHNLLFFWVLSHACLHPGKWLLAVAACVCVWMARVFAANLRDGVIGFEMDEQGDGAGVGAGMPGRDGGGGGAARGGARLERARTSAGRPGGGPGDDSDDEDEDEDDEDGGGDDDRDARRRRGGIRGRAAALGVSAAAVEAADRLRGSVARRAARVGRAAATMGDAAAAGFSAAGAAAALSAGLAGSSRRGGGGGGGGGDGIGASSRLLSRSRGGGGGSVAGGGGLSGGLGGGGGGGGGGAGRLLGPSGAASSSASGGLGSAPASAADLFQSLMSALDGGGRGFDLDSLGDIEQLGSVSNVLRLARQHSGRLADYALVAQNVLDDVAALAERCYACATGQDVLASALFYGAVLCAAGFMAYFGVGAGVLLAVAFLLRPPFLRAVPGVFGIRAFLANLPSRSADEIQ